METAPLKSFAIWARTALIREVTARIAVVLAPASPERVEHPKAVAALENAVNAAGGGDKGRSAVADRVAYTWFNRVIALRFMDANGYTGIGVVSPQAGVEVGQPEVLAEAKRGTIDPEVVGQKARDAISGLLDGTRRSDDPQGEAYALLLAEYCRHWNRSMPFMFEREGDFTELLIPANLLADDSVLNRAAKVLTKDVCEDVEVIGWLYQFYISERKDEVFSGFKKGKKAGTTEIPAATQLFTPHWIVRYLVENSLGRLWMLNRPNSRLIDKMEYYIAPIDEETNFLKIGSPEELTVIDPACGSGHMLTYAFDLLYAIYEEEGYAPSEIPALILAHNLFGTEIDSRAGALAAFALTMKARGRQRRFFAEIKVPNVCVTEPISFTLGELDDLAAMNSTSSEKPYGRYDRDDIDSFWTAFEHADMIGSLIRPREDLVEPLEQWLNAVSPQDVNLFVVEVLARAKRVIMQAQYLCRRYVVVIANPPYMGSGNMGGTLVDLIKLSYSAEKQDLYACFVSQAFGLVRPNGLIAMIVSDTWMTLSSFAEFRSKLIKAGGLIDCLHLDDVSNHPDVFGANTAFILEQGGARNVACSFVHLEPLSGEEKRLRFLDAIKDPASSPYVFSAVSSTFATIPGQPFAYRMSDAVRAVFGRFPALSTFASARQGLSPGNTARFVRFWFEVDRNKIGFGFRDSRSALASRRKWFPFNKGGAFRRWYGNIEHILNWEYGGKELHDFRPKSVIRNPDYFFKPAVTWSSVSSGAPAFRVVDPGVIFSDVGQSVFGDDLVLATLLGTLNSQYGHHVLAMLAPSLHFQAGTIATIPINLDLDPSHRNLVNELVEISRRDWDSQELSYGFERPEWFADRALGKLDAIVRARREFWDGETNRMRELEAKNDKMVLSAYELNNQFESGGDKARVSLLNNPYFRFDGAADLTQAGVLFARAAVMDLISYAVGCMFGRYSIDEPGLILADQGATLQDYLKKIPSPTFKPDADNVLPIVDGDWFEDDIVARFRQFLRVAFGENHFEENLRFVTESLDVKDLRDYFAKLGARATTSRFYDEHVQRYKKRPIYWLFSSPKGSFNALIYMHRYTPSTVSTVLNEYLREFKAKLESSLQHQERLTASGGTPRQQAAAQKEADRLRNVLLELGEYEHDVLYPLASQQVTINLDDGVKVNYPKFGAALKKIPGLEASE